MLGYFQSSRRVHAALFHILVLQPCAWTLTTALSTPRTICILFHKPLGTVTTHHDQLGRRTVYEALEDALPQELSSSGPWHSCGRLDLDTSGLLLLTNDGGCVDHVTNPTSKPADASVPKTYKALCMGKLDPANVERLRQGVDLCAGLGVSAPARVEVLGYEERPPKTWLAVTISEGKNRQVRRMIHAVGSGVMKLQRISIGKLELDGRVESPGDWRVLEDAEVRSALGYEPRFLSTSLQPLRAPRRNGGSRRKVLPSTGAHSRNEK
jgi:pseudouridine synthase